MEVRDRSTTAPKDSFLLVLPNSANKLMNPITACVYSSHKRNIAATQSVLPKIMWKWIPWSDQLLKRRGRWLGIVPFYGDCRVSVMSQQEEEHTTVELLLQHQCPPRGNPQTLIGWHLQGMTNQTSSRSYFLIEVSLALKKLRSNFRSPYSSSWMELECATKCRCKLLALKFYLQLKIKIKNLRISLVKKRTQDWLILG